MRNSSGAPNMAHFRRRPPGLIAQIIYGPPVNGICRMCLALKLSAPVVIVLFAFLKVQARPFTEARGLATQAHPTVRFFNAKLSTIHSNCWKTWHDVHSQFKIAVFQVQRVRLQKLGTIKCGLAVGALMPTRWLHRRRQCKPGGAAACCQSRAGGRRASVPAQFLPAPPSALPPSCTAASNGAVRPSRPTHSRSS